MQPASAVGGTNKQGRCHVCRQRILFCRQSSWSGAGYSTSPQGSGHTLSQNPHQDAHEVRVCVASLHFLQLPNDTLPLFFLDLSPSLQGQALHYDSTSTPASSYSKSTQKAPKNEAEEHKINSACGGMKVSDFTSASSDRHETFTNVAHPDSHNHSFKLRAPEPGC